MGSLKREMYPTSGVLPSQVQLRPTVDLYRQAPSCYATDPSYTSGQVLRGGFFKGFFLGTLVGSGLMVGGLALLNKMEKIPPRPDLSNLWAEEAHNPDEYRGVGARQQFYGGAM